MSTRIVVLGRDAPQQAAALGAARPDVEFYPVVDVAQGPLPDTADAVFGWGVPPELLDRVSNIRWVQWWAAGVERALALPASVLLTRMEDAFTPDMAEHVLGCLLDWVKNFDQARRQQVEHLWARYETASLHEQVLVVAGAGHIGGGIAERLEALGVEVRRLARTHRTLADGTVVFGTDESETALRGANGVVLVLPHTPDTTGFLNADRIGWLARGAVVVNVGRGSAVDEGALVAALSSGQLSRAYLDVVSQEPLPEHSALWDAPGLRLTPHVSGPNRHDDVLTYSLENLARWERGEPLRGLVDRQRGY
ncbi:MAG: NAD(P)-dependent oxidoreductase [Thermaerobacter sp.]|nr:NAD(P)-dependent oxidoreductase [Thermaerobacter sp.]